MIQLLAAISHGNRMTVKQLREHCLEDSAGIAIQPGRPAAEDTGSELLLRQQMNRLTPAIPTETTIVFADNPIPLSLGNSFSACPHLPLRRLTDTDLIYFPREIVSAADSQQSMWSLALKTVRRIDCLDRISPPDRFPAAGPGNAVISPKTIQSRLSADDAVEGASECHRSCLYAGLLLLWDHLDASHRVSQSLQGIGNPRTADYWHAIMHRREPDPGNAAYWFRSLGHHPAFDLLRTELPGWLKELHVPGPVTDLIQQQLLRQERWNPFAMIDLCGVALNNPGGTEDSAVRVVQYLEILNLLRSGIHSR